jgi:cell division protein FtsB
MVQRTVTLVLLALLAMTHAQLWLGEGSVDRVKELQAQIHEQQAANDLAQKKTQRLRSEVDDLKTGQEMIEEKARSELGMLKPHEVYVHILQR